MNATNFLASDYILALPKRSNPKVYLSIDNQKVAKVAFNLYNPFSIKAKLLKKTARFFCVHCNKIAKLILPTIKCERSDFIIFLEKKFDTTITSSVYVATERDKLVVQLQNENGILGYLKYPLTAIGEKRLLNEQKAISLLAKLEVVPDMILKKRYQGTPYMILQSLEGNIGPVSADNYKKILALLKKKKSYQLSNHPRVFNIRKKLKKHNRIKLIEVLDKSVFFSKNEYLEVYEHGDFAPWNVIETKNGFIPFDFEYFKKRGLEFLDEIKFHFQIEYLLNGKTGMSLIEAISEKTDIQEFNTVFKVFLLKEIINKLEANEEYGFELSLLELKSIEKA